MAGPGLPVNIDSFYADSGTDPSVKIHQQNSDIVHTYVNKHDASFLTGTSGQYLGYNSSGLVVPTSAVVATNYATVAPAPSGGDDSAALQAALNTISNPGGKVILRPGFYHLDSASLIANAPGLILEGSGAPAQSPILGLGGTQLRVASGLWGFRYNMNDGGAAYAGPQLRNLAFYQGASGALGGVQITHAHNFSLQGVTAEGFDTGIGFAVEGVGDCCQYGTFDDVRGSNCQVGLRLTACNGMRIIGGMFDASNNSAVIPAGTTAIQMVSGDTLRMFGTVIQFYATAVDLQQGTGHELQSIRVEGATIGIRVRGSNDHARIFGGSISNYIVGSGGTAIQVDSGAQLTQILMPSISSVGTQLANSGANTTSFIDNALTIAGRTL